MLKKKNLTRAAELRCSIISSFPIPAKTYRTSIRNELDQKTELRWREHANTFICMNKLNTCIDSLHTTFSF
jgi:hypothetical protein